MYSTLQYLLGSLMAFHVSAHSYGTPTVLSSYAFTDINSGAPNNNTGVCSDNGGSDGWNCQHRYPAIAGMVGFANIAGTTEVVDWANGTDQQIAFGRGSVGFGMCTSVVVRARPINTSLQLPSITPASLGRKISRPAYPQAATAMSSVAQLFPGCVAASRESSH